MSAASRVRASDFTGARCGASQRQQPLAGRLAERRERTLPASFRACQQGLEGRDVAQRVELRRAAQRRCGEVTPADRALQVLEAAGVLADVAEHPPFLEDR